MVLLVASVAMAPGAASEPDPRKAQALVQDATEEMLSVLRDAAGEDDVESIRQKLEDIILPKLDFVTMTKLAVGRNWLDASDEQKRALVGAFRKLLVRTYADSLAEYEDQKIEFLPLEPGNEPERVRVRSKVIQKNDDDIPVHYRLRYNSGDWAVYDIVIDGVSLVRTYRSSFASQIDQGGIAALIEKLEQKNAEGETADTAP
jgi:phospholipid transport system substrate-binding protein